MSAIDIVRSYSNAWESGNIEAARGLLTDDLTFQGSMERHETADGFLTGLQRFLPMFVSAKTITEVVDGNQVFRLYDAELQGGKTLRLAEHFEVSGDKISKIHLVFDTAGMIPSA